jgi:MinD superfamily P-loop ATPase containing an inserted ferredoxin domain
MGNRIYFFSGTGNSLKVAKDIAKALPDCELVAIYKDTPLEIPSGYERIGFVFPNYAGGPPAMVKNFIGKMKYSDQSDTYIFCVATYGGNDGGVISQMGDLLQQRGLQLNYGAIILSYPNAVTAYPLPKEVDVITKTAEINSQPVIESIIAKLHKHFPPLEESAKKRYDIFLSSIHNRDIGYHVNNDCISCGICRDVCPAKNITLENGIPVFHHQCECCMACIQHCPKRAINYENKTQDRGRYTHPDIGHEVISQYYQR